MNIKKLMTSTTSMGREEPKDRQKCEKCNGGGMIYDKEIAKSNEKQVKDFYYECHECGGDGFIFTSKWELMEYMKTYT